MGVPVSDDIIKRKDAHLDICLEKAVEPCRVTTGLGGYTLEYDALPELDFDKIDISTTFLNRRLRAPIIIGAMTGGTERAKKINHCLAKAASRVGVGMALGSQRAMIVKPELSSTYAVRDVAPELPLLFGNIGAVQLNLGVTSADISKAVKAVGADALYFHLNPLQEAIQPEGDTCFAGLQKKLAEVIPQIDIPCLAKEVGAGISSHTAEKLAKLPLAGVETAGLGGTSWTKVESYRAPKESIQAKVGDHLAGFGVPTAQSIQNCRNAFGNRPIVASGGIRTGMDIAVALALGANAVALAKPMLAAAVESEEAVVLALETLIFELRVICFCTGAQNINALRNVTLRRPLNMAAKNE